MMMDMFMNMFVFFPVVMPVIMSMVVFMVMFVIMFMVVFVVMPVIMSMVVFVVMPVIMPGFLRVMMFVRMPVQIFHIVIMILVLFIQKHRKIAAVHTGLPDPGYFHGKSVRRNTVQRFHQNFFAGAQIEEGRHRHISADPGITFQVKCFCHRLFSFLLQYILDIKNQKAFCPPEYTDSCVLMHFLFLIPSYKIIAYQSIFFHAKSEGFRHTFSPER